MLYASASKWLHVCVFVCAFVCVSVGCVCVCVCVMSCMFLMYMCVHIWVHACCLRVRVPIRVPVPMRVPVMPRRNSGKVNVQKPNYRPHVSPTTGLYRERQRGLCDAAVLRGVVVCLTRLVCVV